MTNGAQISFIRSGSVVLTRVCSQACSYCAFRSSEENVLSVANLHENLYRIRKSGATEAVFICGDSPQEYPLTLVALKKEGFSSFADYLEHSCKLALTYELLPVLSVGALDLFASKKLAHVAALIRIPVFSSDLFGAGKAHENSRRRTFGNAKIAIENSVSAGLPYSMDLIFGIGEPRDQRVDFIRDLGKRYASDPLLQDLRLVPFHPLPETKFHDQPPMDFDAVSNLIFSLKESFPSHPISIPTHLFSRYPELFSYGLNDLGSLPDSTQDPIMPAFPVPSFAAVKTRLLERNIFLFERLSVLTAAGIQRRAIAVAVNACHRRLKRRDTQSLDFIDNHQCFVCGTQNSNGLKLSFTKHSKDTCISEWIGDPRFQGYAGILHGGLVATLVDEAMAHCLISAGMRVVTAEISVRYLQPTPLGVSLTILGTVIESKRRIHLTKGSVRLSDGTILAEAEGKYSEY